MVLASPTTRFAVSLGLSFAALHIPSATFPSSLILASIINFAKSSEFCSEADFNNRANLSGSSSASSIILIAAWVLLPSDMEAESRICLRAFIGFSSIASLMELTGDE